VFYNDRVTNAKTSTCLVNIIISLLKSPLLGHRPSLWITHKENQP
jgi:hypothetical protein